ncbi:hypothetical protein EDB84DRAFT_1445319 [Lactarius hengduanensis]|nr:hypothetical protein EDB84DRAFT_1445319 [Lactarius hengduanensis]
MSSESALTHAEADYREGNIDSKIRQHLTAPSQEHSDESFAGFIMAIDLKRLLVYTVMGINIPVQVIFSVQLTRKDNCIYCRMVQEAYLLSHWPLAEVAAVVEVNTNTEHIVAAGTMELRDMHLVGLCDLRSVFEKSSQTSGAGEGTADRADRCMPKGTRSVSKLVLSMSVSAILGLAWVGEELARPVCSSQACEKHALTWMLGVQTGSWNWTGGTDKNSGHATHTEDNADMWIRFRSSMHQHHQKCHDLLSVLQFSLGVLKCAAPTTFGAHSLKIPDTASGKGLASTTWNTATRHLSSQRAGTTHQHHFRAGHGLRRFSRVSKRFDVALQLALYHTLELSTDDADACVARLAGALHLAALVTTLVLRAPTCPRMASPALRSMCALSAPTQPAFDMELLAAAPLTDTLPYTLFDNFLAVPARARITHLALPHFFGVSPAAHVVSPNAAPHLAVLDNSPGLAAALGSGHPLCRLTLRIARTLYDGLRLAALFGALGSTRKELGLILAPNVDIRMGAGEYGRGAGGTRAVSGALQMRRVDAPPAGYSGDRGSQGRRRPVASRGMDTASAWIGIALHRVSFWGARAGSGYA